MQQAPKTVEVLDPISLIVHAIAALGAVGALATGPLLSHPTVLSALLGEDFNVSPLHSAFAGLALLGWLGHLARTAMKWLEGGFTFSLIPRLGDLTGLVTGLLWNLGIGKAGARGRYGYRERLPYFVQLIALPVLVLTGFTLASPALPASVLGPGSLMILTEVHFTAGYIAAAAFMLHLFFSLFTPGALFFNASFLTGKASWARVERMRPAWAGELMDEFVTREEEQGEKPQSVFELLERGNAEAKAGDLNEARATYEEALELFPGYSQALFNLAVVLIKLDDKGAAAERLRQYLKQDAFGPAAGKASQLLEELGELGEGGR